VKEEDGALDRAVLADDGHGVAVHRHSPPHPPPNRQSPQRLHAGLDGADRRALGCDDQMPLLVVMARISGVHCCWKTVAPAMPVSRSAPWFHSLISRRRR